MKVIPLSAPDTPSYAGNCYLVCDDEGKNAVVVDPSVPYDGATASLSPLPKIGKILLTHAHFDHVWYAEDWHDKTGAPVGVAEEDADALGDPWRNGEKFFFDSDKTYRQADFTFGTGDKIPVGSEELAVLATPGHTPGSVTFIGNGFLLTGDTIMTGGHVGRTDLPGGDRIRHLTSLRILLSMPEEYRIYPGHGEQGTVGEERHAHGFD